MRYSIVFPLISAVSAITSPPSGATTVSSGGSIQDAIDSGATTIFVEAGTYSEQLYITGDDVTIYGYSSSTDYSGNQVTVTSGLSQANGLSNDETATIRSHGDNFKIYNVDIVNSYGSGSQAVALSLYGDYAGIYGCSLQGYQDTFLSEEGHHYVAQSQIIGATDFIFGQDALLWIEDTDIGVIAKSLGYVTANGRDSSSNPSYYVINNSRVAAAPGNSVTDGAYYLGRPWGDYARVVFQNSELSAVINDAGWHIWNTGDERTDNVLFGEYDNTGDGAWNSGRASFATQLSSAVSITTILGSTSWVDSSYL